MLRASDAFPQLPGTARSVIAPYRGGGFSETALPGFWPTHECAGPKALQTLQNRPVQCLRTNDKDQIAPLARNMNNIPKYFSIVRFEIFHAEFPPHGYFLKSRKSDRGK